MTKVERLNILAEAMDVGIDVLLDDTVLSSLDEWDSLAALSLMAVLNGKMNKKITPLEIKELNTVADALKLME
ncbi:phosphopantetheine-binding protein [Selenomonas sp. AE3005]|uniref:phosphopantetheine-binding protein n=1 Tax=Selenomonas sp. AE3005 TaxID=1485543 RepID=UPI00047FEDE3|nr:phosphopantetheine-binding protein [Selenomonas sp. AE3005]